MGSGTLIKKAEERYGLSSFTKIILFDFNTFDDMNEKEHELVQLSNCYPIDPLSYNLREGGGKLFSEESKIKLSESLKNSDKLKGQNNPMYGKNHDLSSILKMSLNNSGTKDKQWMYNKYLKINKCVFPIEALYLSSIGWESGRIDLKQEKNKESHLGLKWIHNLELKIETSKKPEDL